MFHVFDGLTNQLLGNRSCDKQFRCTNAELSYRLFYNVNITVILHHMLSIYVKPCK